VAHRARLGSIFTATFTKPCGCTWARLRRGWDFAIPAIEEAIKVLRGLANACKEQNGPERPAALARLYRALAVFVSENFEHMEYEESVHNPELWANDTDAELMAIEEALVDSKSRAQQAAMLPWFITGFNPPELAAMLGGMTHGMPAPACEGILGMARGLLPPDRFTELTADVGVQQ
jgi:hypothetical protein